MGELVMTCQDIAPIVHEVDRVLPANPTSRHKLTKSEHISDGCSYRLGMPTTALIIITVLLFIGQSVLLFCARRDTALTLLCWQLSDGFDGVLWVALLLRRMASSPQLRGHWGLLTASGAVFTSGDFVDVISQHLFHQSTSVYVMSTRDLLSLSGFIPAFLLIALPAGRRYFRFFVWMDFVQASTAVCAIYVLLFHAMPFSARPDGGISFGYLSHLYEIAQCGVVVGLLLHYLAAVSLNERRFYLFCFLFMTTTSASYSLDDEISLLFPNEIATNIVCYGVSFFNLLVLLYLVPDEEAAMPSVQAGGFFTDMFNIGSPVLSSAGLLTLGLALLPHPLGKTVIVVAFAMFAVRCTVYLRNFEQAQRRLENASARLELLSYTDELTGVANRRAFDYALDSEWQHGARSGSPLSLILIDVDFFKQLNDSAGHQAGDACLSAIAKALNATLPRSTDMLGRYGGDEFAVILPSTDGEAAIIVATMLCEAVRALEIAHPATPLGHATLSLGISTCTTFGGQTATRLLSSADEALYAAKKAGRNGWRSLCVP